jgi:hypothetical protein
MWKDRANIFRAMKPVVENFLVKCLNWNFAKVLGYF